MLFFKSTADEGAADYLGPNDRFPETPGIVDQLDQNDCALKDDQGIEHSCRLFLIRVRHGGKTHYLRVGFELKPGAVLGQDLDNVQKLGQKTYLGSFGFMPYFVFLRR
jgi:hypothetical protein